jgi:hypothetical protein
MISYPTPDLNEIQKAFDAIVGNRIVEIRAPATLKGTWSGYFNDASLVKDVYELSSKETTPNVYWTLQEISPELLRVGHENKLYSGVGKTTDDTGITRYVWLPIDCDPVRDPKLSATDDEKAEAESVACDIRRFLDDLNISSVLADSGNGYHVLVPLDIPNRNGTKALIEKVLKALNARFGNRAVGIDESVFNPSRILKVYGSVARKGAHTDERPWRLSRLINVPSNLTPLSEMGLKELLSEIIKVLPSEKQTQIGEPKKAYEAPTTGTKITSDRNNAIRDYAWDVWRKQESELPDVDDLKSKVYAFNEEFCVPPLDTEELDRTVLSSTPKKLRAIDEIVMVGGQRAGTQPSVSGPVPLAFDYSTIPEGKDAPKKVIAPLVSIDGDKFMAEKIPPRRVLLRTTDKKEPVFFGQSINQIFAWRGTGKTNVGLGLTSAFATGGSFLNWEVPSKARVLYVEGEMPESQLQERWNGIVGKTNGYARLVTIDKQPLHMIPSLATQAGMEAVEATLTALGAEGFDVDVLMLDSISTLFNVQANDEETWITIQAWLVGLRSRGLAIFFFHHSGKGGLSRSHSKSEDMLDVSIKLESPKNKEPGCLHALMTYDKVRGGLDEPSSEIKMRRTHSSACACRRTEGTLIGCRGDGVAWEHKATTDALLALAYEMFDQDATLGEVSKELKVPRATVQYWKNKWEERGRAEPDAIL